ncbi:class I SAM-dependent methyltransferase [Nocardioides marmorisolisilvae]|uniref:Class I SAM-dependent methyltransferase n=1 Tax=Nocardioides marmorisolisilvae TaxID=1542737 RepID=A0A3N0DTT0_9ACTN|nr:class I SAM-dependent methyltransferase [Nocardioides marmorisolisilvae]RNL79020.1 class I SAM-dependent methyltransferase [Nocardioides marmorisolisilvae]
MTNSTATRGQRFFASWYPSLMGKSEEAGQGEMRREQLAQAKGKTLEIGAGNGFSVPYYTDKVKELTLIEPNAVFREQLIPTLATAVPKNVAVVDGDVHALAYPDASFDTVTASLVFCSVTDPQRALAEIHRVLKPGGRFLFHEHVRGHGLRGVAQDLITPLQRRLADGCHANRDFEALLFESDLELDELVRTRMPAGAPTIVPLVVGAARRVA